MSRLIDQHTCGVYRKFDVKRRDGRDGRGGDRSDAQYFVLDLKYDPHAKAAIKAYAKSCKHAYPLLADDLMSQIQPMPEPTDWRSLLNCNILVRLSGGTIGDTTVTRISPSGEYLFLDSLSPYGVSGWFAASAVQLLDVLDKA